MSTKRKMPTKFSQPLVKQTAKKILEANLNEADAVVSTLDTQKPEGKAEDGALIELSSDPESSEYELTEDEPEDDLEPTAKTDAKFENGSLALRDKADLDEPSHKDAEGDSDQEPTFGELVRANETVDVPAALAAQQPAALVNTGKILAPPSHASLGTVLSQALRTDDTDLLESCLHTTNLPTIRNTIQRLDSSLAGVLLTKLASRMHRRPGRAGSLMAWVQWTLVAHGGALATQPGLVKKLSELNRVLEERSRGLNSLLALKGKLDLLEAQMQLRRSMQAAREDSDDDEEGVVYVEGEEVDGEFGNGDMEVDDDEFPVTNGIVNDEDSDEDEEDGSDGEEPDEVTEVVEDAIDEEEVDFDDKDSQDQNDQEDEDSDVEQPPAKKRGRNGRRK